MKTRERTSTTPVRGVLPKWQQEIKILDDSFAESDPRHVVLEAHCYRHADGTVGASGLIDPKEILVADVRYVRLAYQNPVCELCENGEMIPYEERFERSSYTPMTPPLSTRALALSKLNRRLYRAWDLLDQKSAVEQTMPK